MSIENSRQLNACGCCQPAEPLTPEAIWNRPGLPSIDYRVGTYASFRQAMLFAIISASVDIDGSEVRPFQQEGRQWTTRSEDDYGIAILDMWAYLADILTFYQERIANEVFLETALHADAVRRLVALLNYRPAPGVAAGANLAFTTEPDKKVQIPVGLLVQSVPGQDEKPQKFETIEELVAEEWLNVRRIFPEPTDHPPLAENSYGGILDEDFSEPLAPGDQLVLFFKQCDIDDVFEVLTNTSRVLPTVEEKRITSIEKSIERIYLNWSEKVLNPRKVCWRYGRKFRLFGVNAPESWWDWDIIVGTYDSDDSPLIQYDHPTWIKEITDFTRTLGKVEDIKISKKTFKKIEYFFHLDGTYDDITPGTQFLAIIDSAQFTDSYMNKTMVAILKVKQVELTSLTIAQMSGSTTKITMEPVIVPIGLDTIYPLTIEKVDIRRVTIYELMGSPVKFWGMDYVDEITGNKIYIPCNGLGEIKAGRKLILDDKSKIPQVVEVLYPPEIEKEHLKITFTPELERPLQTESAVLYGNVAEATQGETVQNEILGSGNAAEKYQNFVLKKPPTTYIASPDAPGGAKNTLTVRVGGVKWEEVPDLYGRSSTDRVYITRRDEDGNMSVGFGDGRTGATPPTGSNNIAADYRQGLGRDGNVAGNTLTTLLGIPLGLKAVNNPLAAEGGADSESFENARVNAPKTVLIFDRIVSLRDFEVAARQFIGIAKARAAYLWDGEDQKVCLTVAGDDGAVIDSGSKVMKDLVGYLNARRDPNKKMSVQSHEGIRVVIEAKIKVNPDFQEEDVRDAAHAAIVDYFNFYNLDLGQSIHLSEIYKIIHDVDGVVAVDIERFDPKSDIPVEFLSDNFRVLKHLPILSSQLAYIEKETEDVIVTVGMESA